MGNFSPIRGSPRGFPTRPGQGFDGTSVSGQNRPFLNGHCMVAFRHARNVRVWTRIKTGRRPRGLRLRTNFVRISHGDLVLNHQARSRGSKPVLSDQKPYIFFSRRRAMVPVRAISLIPIGFNRLRMAPSLSAVPVTSIV
jgi:hypothetical protein